MADAPSATPRCLVWRFGSLKQKDKDGEGSLDIVEFKKLVRAGLQIKPLDMPDAHVEALMESLDEDGGGGISAEEIEDFLLI